MMAVDCSVPEELAGARLDRALAHVSGTSRRLARLAIGEGRVSLGGRTVRIFTREVRAGQRLRCAAAAASVQAGAPLGHKAPAPAAGAATQAARSPGAKVPGQGVAHGARASTPADNLRIVHLDAYVVVVDKPAGLLSEPDRFGAPSAEALLPGLLAARGEASEVWLVHRLDAGTSGLLLFARRRSAARRLFANFAAREVRKVYHAVVAGHFATPRSAREAIARLKGTRHGVVTDGKPAATDFVPLQPGARCSLVEARPITGRTHQIRVHLAHMGFPIVGDGLYGGPRYLSAKAGQARAMHRPLLHAYALEVAHPSLGGAPPLRLTLPPPPDFAEALALQGAPPP